MWPCSLHALVYLTFVRSCSCSCSLQLTINNLSHRHHTFLDEQYTLYTQSSCLILNTALHLDRTTITNNQSCHTNSTYNIHTTYTLPRMDVSKLLQLQTSVAHPQHIRPQAQPQQQHRIPSLSPSNSTDSTDSMSRHGSQSSHSSHSYSGEISSPNSPPRTPLLRSPTSACDEIVRCSRCHRSASLSSPGPLDSMISFGLNLYYCGRCASMVGYKR